MMNNTVRIYGKELERWTYEHEKYGTLVSQIEVAYIEYDANTGEIVGTGSEDFSMKRWSQEVKGAYVWTWDGEKLNKGGHRWFEQEGYYRFRKSEAKQFKLYMNTKFTEAALVQIRKG